MREQSQWRIGAVDVSLCENKNGAFKFLIQFGEKKSHCILLAIPAPVRQKKDHRFLFFGKSDCLFFLLVKKNGRRKERQNTREGVREKAKRAWGKRKEEEKRRQKERKVSRDLHVSHRSVS